MQIGVRKVFADKFCIIGSGALAQELELNGVTPNVQYCFKVSHDNRIKPSEKQLTDKLMNLLEISWLLIDTGSTTHICKDRSLMPYLRKNQRT